jgi:hypothetical protein
MRLKSVGKQAVDLENVIDASPRSAVLLVERAYDFVRILFWNHFNVCHSTDIFKGQLFHNLHLPTS